MRNKVTTKIIESKDLLGVWKLISYIHCNIEDEQDFTYPYGNKAQGYIIFIPEGRVSVLIVDSQRPKPLTRLQYNEAMESKLFQTMLSYGGRFTLENNTAYVKVDISWNQTMTGSTQIRHLQLSEDHLIITTNPKNMSSGKKIIAKLVWKKL